MIISHQYDTKKFSTLTTVTNVKVMFFHRRLWYLLSFTSTVIRRRTTSKVQRHHFLLTHFIHSRGIELISLSTLAWMTHPTITPFSLITALSWKNDESNSWPNDDKQRGVQYLTHWIQVTTLTCSRWKMASRILGVTCSHLGYVLYLYMYNKLYTLYMYNLYNEMHYTCILPNREGWFS